MRCHMFRFWGKPWRRRRGGPVPAVRVWMEMAGVEGARRRGGGGGEGEGVGGEGGE